MILRTRRRAHDIWFARNCYTTACAGIRYAFTYSVYGNTAKVVLTDRVDLMDLHGDRLNLDILKNNSDEL